MLKKPGSLYEDAFHIHRREVHTCYNSDFSCHPMLLTDVFELVSFNAPILSLQHFLFDDDTQSC